MRGTSRQIARVDPRRAVSLLVVAAMAVACTSEPSPAEKSAASQAARQNAIANADVREAVKAIKLCVRDSEGEYPPAIKKQSGTITMLCGSVSRSVHLSRGEYLTYAPKHGGFTVVITSRDGSKVNYDSTSSEPSGS